MRVLRNFLTDEEVRRGRRCFKAGGLLDYGCMDGFVRQILSRVDPSARAMKYRASDNSNSSDAGHFHRDVCNYDAHDIPEIYTVLFYLDEAEMEIVPGSHRSPVMSLMQGMRQKSTALKMNPGDVLIFNACTLHKGKFKKNNSGHRRLIQVFDTTFGGTDYTDRVLHLPCIGMCKTHNFSKISDFLAKSSVFKPVSKITYVNASTGYGARYRPLEGTRYTMISQEAGAPRHQGGDAIDVNNRYRILNPGIHDVDEKDWYRVHYTIHVRSVHEFLFGVAILFLVMLYIYVVARR